MLDKPEVVKKLEKAKTDSKTKLANLLNEKLTPIQKNYNTYLPKVRATLEKNNQYLQDLIEGKKTKVIKY